MLVICAVECRNHSDPEPKPAHSPDNMIRAMAASGIIAI